MTSMAELLGREQDFATVREALLAHANEILPGGPFAPGALPDVEAPADA